MIYLKRVLWEHGRESVGRESNKNSLSGGHSESPWTKSWTAEVLYVCHRTELRLVRNSCGKMSHSGLCVI